ncbi:VWA domain-containing protein [Sulfitobacter sp. S0837]|uniref:TadE/TadG family type IV pilus assembly protein n=1 Tax=Sulfitobacter maritimus TaxID=2741719 RepID=UPI0015817047|nr:TadE/TadG family type IV pilus assembly protein [Sulfitobacter maritimus]NUH64230.1 VWA domain-containing protein [Sulfitobacter maritimus]
MRNKTAFRQANQFSKFKKSEDGGILILSLFLFVGMMIFGGLAVDLANHERTRTTFQTHLDNAVLAAASLSQDLSAEDVVYSYLSSAGLDPSGVNVDTSTEKIGGIVVGRTVNASMNRGINTYFFRFFDYDTLDMTIASQATERVEDIEISLVLDVSGSMNNYASDRSGRKIYSLKRAAKDFVEEVLSEAEEGRVSISIVPYAHKVNVGRDLLRQYNATNEHDYSHCVDFEAEDFQSLAIDPDVQIQTTGHFRISSASNSYYNSPTRGTWVCRNDTGFAITPLSSSAFELKRQIDNLWAGGTTSIEVGAKWGLALLDPSAQRPIAALASEGIVNPAFRGRPHPHNAENNMKVLVIMTDGENTTEQQLRPEYASGNSDLIQFTSNGGKGPYYNVVSRETANQNDGDRDLSERYFYASYPPVTNNWYWPWYSSDKEGNSSGDPFWNDNLLDSNPQFASDRDPYVGKNLTWAEVWYRMSPHYYAYNMRGRQMNDTGEWHHVAKDQWNQMVKKVGSGVKDNRLKSICGVAQRAGIVIYTIGMDVRYSNSLEILKECASTEAHYFDVKGMEIQSAFEMIAASISMLRLTK